MGLGIVKQHWVGIRLVQGERVVELEHANLQQSLPVNIFIGTSTQIVLTAVHAKNVNHILENNQPCKKLIISHANSHVGPTLPCLANSQVGPTSVSLTYSQVGPTFSSLANSQVGPSFAPLANIQMGSTLYPLANTPNGGQLLKYFHA